MVLKQFNVVALNGSLHIEETVAHSQRRHASFMLYLKTFPLAVIVMAALWLPGRMLMEYSDCSGLKTFENECPCEGPAIRAYDAFRYFMCMLLPSYSSWFILVYKVVNLRHGIVLPQNATETSYLDKVSHMIRRVASTSTSANVSGTDLGSCEPVAAGNALNIVSPADETEMIVNSQVVVPRITPSDSPEYASSRCGGLLETKHLHPDDVLSMPKSATKPLLIEAATSAVLYTLIMSILTGALEMTTGSSFAVFMLCQPKLIRRFAKKLNPNVHPGVAKPMTVFVLMVVFCAGSMSGIQKLLEAKPHLVDVVFLVFPFLISFYEVLAVDVVGSYTAQWSDEDASILARFAISMIEAFRAGMLLAAATLENSTGAFKGTFFRTLVLGMVTDAGVRNDLHTTIFLKLFRGCSDEQVVERRRRFMMIYMGSKTDCGYVAWTVVLMAYIANWGPNSAMVDCDLKLYHTYSPEFQFVMAGVVGEVGADIFAMVFRFILGRIRPLWVVPLYHVSTEGTVVVRTLYWVAMFGISSVGLSATALVLDTAEGVTGRGAAS